MKITYRANLLDRYPKQLSVYLIENIGPFCNETLVTYILVFFLSLSFLPFAYSTLVLCCGILLAWYQGANKVKRFGSDLLTLDSLVSEIKEGKIIYYKNKPYMIISHDKTKRNYVALNLEEQNNIEIGY
jgi:hypothetical protein